MIIAFLIWMLITIASFALTALMVKALSLCCALEDGYISDEEADEKRLECCPLVEVEQLTDTEKRLFLSAVGREEDICKKIDSEKELDAPGVKELTPAVRSVERKVMKALWA